jgi:coenzyme PQQ precursor peptide PqqA
VGAPGFITQNDGGSQDQGWGSTAVCNARSRESASDAVQINHHGGIIMWTKPEYTEMRFGFEVTMYIASR